MNNVGKVVLFALIIIYIVSPLDAFPGPIDDAILLLLSIIGSVRSGKGKEED